MGQVDGVRFCDACGEAMNSEERLVRVGDNMVCAGCSGVGHQRPPAKAVRSRSRLGAAALWCALAGIALCVLGPAIAIMLKQPSIGAVQFLGLLLTCLSVLLALVGLIVALATGREHPGLPAVALAIALIGGSIAGFCGLSISAAQLSRDIEQKWQDIRDDDVQFNDLDL